MTDICENKHGGNAESVAAYAQVPASVRAAQRDDIERWVRSHGKNICEQIADNLGIITQSCSARVSELKASGRLVVTGERRPTRSGCMAAVLDVPRAQLPCTIR